MSAADATNGWLNATRDHYSSGRDHAEAMNKEILGFLDGRVLGYELDTFLKTRVLADDVGRANVPVEEVVRIVEAHYRREADRIRRGSVEAAVAHLVGLVGMINVESELRAVAKAYRGAPRRFVVEWEVRFQDSDNLISEGDHEVLARTPYEARLLTRAWVENNDPGFDDRVDPYVLIRDVIDPSEEDGDGAEEDGRDG